MAVIKSAVSTILLKWELQFKPETSEKVERSVRTLPQHKVLVSLKRKN